MISILVIVGLFAASLVLTIRRGVGATFACVMLPSLLLISMTQPIEVFRLPNISVLGAVSYGVIVGIIVRGGDEIHRARATGFRFGIVDALIVLLSLVYSLAAAGAEELYTGVSATGGQLLEWVVPYFVARLAFYDVEWRGKAAVIACGVALPVALIALVEMRLYPNFFSRTLQPLGLNQNAYDLVLSRFGFFRAQSTFGHPIDLGNGSVLLAAIIVSLAVTGGRRLTQGWVPVGLACCGVMAAASMSWTSYVAILAAVLLFGMLVTQRWTGVLLVPFFLVGLAYLVALTLHWAALPYERVTADTPTLEASRNIRHLIVHSGWPFAASAGWAGHGPTFDVRKMGVLSVDNSYLLMVIRHGWIYLGFFLAVGLAVAYSSGRALARVPTWSARIPLAAGAAAYLGTMAGMYTVFFGFVYSKLFLLVLGLTVSMTQVAVQRTRRQAGPFLQPRV